MRENSRDQFQHIGCITGDSFNICRWRLVYNTGQKAQHSVLRVLTSVHFAIPCTVQSMNALQSAGGQAEVYTVLENSSKRDHWDSYLSDTRKSHLRSGQCRIFSKASRTRLAQAKRLVYGV